MAISIFCCTISLQYFYVTDRQTDVMLVAEACIVMCYVACH